MINLFECYPFQNIGVIVLPSVLKYPDQNFAGLDFFWKRGQEFASFPVYTMYEGDVVFGVNQALGKYFIVSKTVEQCRYETLYAQLEHIDENLQKYAIIQGDKDFVVPAKYFLGMAGTGGSGNGIRKLHIELYEVNLQTGIRKYIDPFGIYNLRGQYPQPGEFLQSLQHVWTSDLPEFIEN